MFTLERPIPAVPVHVLVYEVLVPNLLLPYLSVSGAGVVTVFTLERPLPAMPVQCCFIWYQYPTCCYLCGAGVVTVFTLERPLSAVPVHVLVPVPNLLLPVWCRSSHSVYT